MKSAIILSTLPAVLATLASIASAAPVSFSSTGADAAGMTPGVDAFRAAIGGPVNAPGAGPFASGRREINWDAPALDAFASPALMPNNFFNNNSKRGAAFTTPGSGFLVSQRAAQAGFTAPRFGDINPAYAAQFQTFSAERLFAAKDSTVTDVFFFVPSDPATPATVSSFGAVFADVDDDATTFLEFFDLSGNLLHQAFASPNPSGLTFIGTTFDAGERIARVRIHAGTLALGAANLESPGADIVAMDDFFYAEPQAVPTPGTASLLAAGAVGLRRRRR
ncbi:MAG: PEP-CTERM sorting domain-containing protein [Planctomycetes bacterium]|nr:PEP-CTERM sorting domain-containing protein [Planctomycetota bacterium]